MKIVSGTTVLYRLTGLMFIATLPFSLLGAADVSFFKENISFVICAADTIEVRGLYLFSNTGDSCHHSYIYYPFPIDTNSAYPHRIAVSRSDRRTAIEFQKLPAGIEWRQTIPAHGIDTVFVVYRQKVKPGIGRYIVSTTKMWEKPLQQADFTVTLPSRMTLTFWAFQADSVSTRGDNVVYHRHFSPFWPDGEMDVRWR